jgi:hypothetical protein
MDSFSMFDGPSKRPETHDAEGNVSQVNGSWRNASVDHDGEDCINKIKSNKILSLSFNNTGPTYHHHKHTQTLQLELVHKTAFSSLPYLSGKM